MGAAEKTVTQEIVPEPATAPVQETTEGITQETVKKSTFPIIPVAIGGGVAVKQYWA